METSEIQETHNLSIKQLVDRAENFIEYMKQIYSSSEGDSTPEEPKIYFAEEGDVSVPSSELKEVKNGQSE